MERGWYYRSHLGRIQDCPSSVFIVFCDASNFLQYLNAAAEGAPVLLRNRTGPLQLRKGGNEFTLGFFSP